MSFLSLFTGFANRAEIRESKDEMMVGEIVRAMSRRHWPAIGFRATDDRQWVQFKTVGDTVLTHVYVTLDRKTGGSALQEAVLGSKATLTIAAELKNYMTDPDDLLAMYKTDLANLFKMPVMGGIKLNHEMNSVFATTTLFIEINRYVGTNTPDVDGLSKLLVDTIDKLRDKLKSYKKS